MKISPTHIVRAHLLTLRKVDAAGVGIGDFFVFYVLPLTVSTLCVLANLQMNDSTYELSISVFSIFSALLLSVQMALFAIFQQEWRATGDKKIDAISKARQSERNNLLKEVNANVSYLILISCFGVTVTLLFVTADLNDKVETFISIFTYFHFFLTLLMIVKRTHALFDKEYSTDGSG